MTDLVSRHLSCIMFTDMVGYSALAQRDEPLALELVAEQRALLRPMFAAHRGREIKSTGDGFLVEFASALEATRCAVDLQRALLDRNAAVPIGKRFQIRVGLHLGDIEIQEGDVFGDGVNVAARVQQCALSGGICLSGLVAEAVRTKLGHPLEPLGARRLKNITTPVELYRVVVPWELQTPWSRLRARVRARAGSRGRALAIGAVAAVVVIGLVWAGLQSLHPVAASEVHSVAILPLEDVSPDPSGEYFADGLTEALIGGLSKIGSLRVISRTSSMRYKESEKPLPEIARELGVDGVLEGSVNRAGDRVRISLRLIHAATEQPLWSETYERSLVDVLALQDEIARAVATAVRVQLSSDEAARLTGARQVDPRAYEAYLRGRYWWNPRTRKGLDKAIIYFRQAIEIDPTWAPGYAGLADVYVAIGFNRFSPPGDVYPKARVAVLQALELDETLAEAHATLSAVMLDYEWDWGGSEREIERALELDPNYARGWQRYAWHLATMAGAEEGLSAIRKARELDPLSPRINAHVGTLLYFTRDYETAERESKESMEADSLQSLWNLGAIYVQQGRFEEAIRAFEEFDRHGGKGARAFLAHAHAVAGNLSEAGRIVEELEQRGQSEFVDTVPMAMAYTGLGDLDRALSWLERGYRERALFVPLIQVDPRLDPLRRDPRFGDLLRRMGLEPAARRIDMSEYMERHAVARLIGAPPGYVGYEEGGQLTEAVRRRPYAVILLDEIEKAHPEVFNILLQVLDDGRLTDGQGRTVDFTNTVLIMTSNVGSQYIQEEEDEALIEARVMDSLRTQFRPEFLNRVDEVVIFHRLREEDLRAIVDIQLDRLARVLAARGLTVELTDGAKEFLASRGWDPVYGARPLKRAIQTWLQNPLAVALLEGRLAEGDHVLVDVSEDGEELRFERAGEPAAAT